MTWTNEIRRDPGVFDELAPWWEDQPGPRAFPYLRHDWFRLWQDCFLPPGATLDVWTWKANGELEAVLPMWRRRSRAGSLSNAHSEVFDLIGGDEEAAAHVVSGLRRRPVVRLFRLDASSPLIGAAGRHWYVDRETEPLHVDLEGGVDAVWAGFSKNLRSNLKRNGHKLERQGEIVYLDNAVGNLDDALDRCLELERAGWKGRNGTAILSRPDTERFYRGLAELAGANDWLRLSVLLVSEKIVAFEFGLDYGGSRFWLKSGYDETVDGSPGLVLKWHVIQRAIEAGLRTYELGGEPEDWKKQWAGRSRRRLNVIAVGDAGVGRLVAPLAKARLSRPPYRPLEVVTA